MMESHFAENDVLQTYKKKETHSLQELEFVDELLILSLSLCSLLRFFSNQTFSYILLSSRKEKGKAMWKPKRALPPSSSSSSGQPSQPKRLCVPPIDQAWNGLGMNPVLSCCLTCCLTKEDLRSMFKEELERAKSDWAEYFQSCIWNALKDLVPQMRSENDSQRLHSSSTNFARSPLSISKYSFRCTSCGKKNMGRPNFHTSLLQHNVPHRQPKLRCQTFLSM